ncbi:restriction system protein [Nitrosomonas cryotolerans]|uniref:Restriction system protein n=1 Tax=Nitrosomonas cryotolerans ATCC 49181 TaxID=1131553 RepID=A0A1N6G9S0_9PROT|nr:restriction endonuclease [Nitrosomonas cryotolerans]SFP51029.1 restriction system protein [Nitrosomonas cryotolerans]SIO04191.1 restriction system protein [Nitrosomonas cryotolerans ATCC 49181]
MQVIMVRSPMSVLNKDYIGYGWAKVNFSEYETAPEVIQKINQEYPQGIRRHTNKVKRFFNLESGDIVIVPLSKAITIGVVNGKKCFDISLAKDQACNLISVNLFRTHDGHILRIARKTLTQGLESRLKIRAANANLTEFKDEIERIIQSIESNGAYKQETYLLEKISEAETVFKENLLKSIISGTTWLSAGGNGLEQLVKELLKIEGYTASIQAKNQSSDIADIDIKASKVDRFSESHLVIQVKHHSNISGEHGLKQLIAYDDIEERNYQKWLITTADLSESSIELAEEHNIKTMVGTEFVDWIYDNITELSFKTKQLLGIIEIPMLAT